MQKLISELTRLYLPADALSAAELTDHVEGRSTRAISLLDAGGMTRGLHIPFRKHARGEEDAHWILLCTLANGLQADLGLPAPAVSISGEDGYGLWMSLASPVPAALAQQFLALLQQAYFPDAALAPDAAGAAVELPPCLHARSGKWAAFINPGLGASFADGSGLEMAPPLGGQVALLESLQRITEAEFLQAMKSLQPLPSAQVAGSTVAAVASTAAPALPALLPTADGLLLKDATLEDIVRHLHSLQIEPTFRHLLRFSRRQ